MNQILKPSIDKNDYIECEYCKNKLYRKTIEWQLYGDKKVLTLDYERCNCKEAEVYWNEYDLKKLKMLEEERKLELMQEFAQKVVDYFTNSYLQGLTPSPCIMCNKHIKLGLLADYARKQGADIIVTGHYAEIRLTSNGVELHRAQDLSRDQSYFLFDISKQNLQMLRCPLATYSKEQTRAIAKEAGLEIHQKADSQDICFVQNGKYAELISDLRQDFKPLPGDIIDTSGKVLGQHKGIIHYTVGQRRGLGIGGDVGILYVLKIDAKHNQIIVGSKEELLQKKLRITDINWLGEEHPQEMELMVKLRSRQAVVPATVSFTEDKCAEISLHTDFYGIAPGQGCCFYQDTRVLGGGIISPF